MESPKQGASRMNQQVIDALRQTVASTYALMGQLHLCHWNVRGKSFFTLHDAFEAQYTELFAAVDEIAERIRAIGAKMAGIKELAEDATAEEMVTHLVEDHRKVLGDLATARDRAAEVKDSETEDMMIARTQVHEKAVWMLTSYLE
jgi:starvation-inducible DNA-binding protein